MLKGSGAKINKPRNPSRVSHNKMIMVVAVGSGCLIQRKKDGAIIPASAAKSHLPPEPRTWGEVIRKERAPRTVKSDCIQNQFNFAFFVCGIA